MYRAYVLAIVVSVAVVIASGEVGDAPVSAAELDQVRHRGAGVLGAVVAAAVCVGVRSGGRGGPLALEAADVRHVLLAPIDRGHVLRAAALRQLRHLGLAAGAAGAAAGQLAARRLPGETAAWLGSGAFAGVLTAGVAGGAGYLAAGRRISARAANAVAALVAAWAAFDIGTESATSPFALIGRVALWPLRTDARGLGAVALSGGLAAAGLAAVGGLSIEAAERRSRLVGRLAFAATLQDLRTVLVLRRQLAQEHPRRRPWAQGTPLGGRWPVWDRGWRGVLRWPAVRIARLMLLGAVAGAALVGVAHGTTPLVIVSAIALHVAALDAVEALAQEVDHPSRTDSIPIARGALHLRHLAVAVVVMLLVGSVGLATAVAMRPAGSTLAVGALTILTTALGSVAGAAISTVAGPPDPFSSWALGAPEIAGVHNVIRLVWPPALAAIGCTPALVAARAASRHSGSVPVATAISVAVALVAAAGVLGWVHARDSVLAQLRSIDLFGKPA